LGNLARLGIETLALGYERLIYADSQRAEYLADLGATRIAGTPATRTMQGTLVLIPLAYDALSGLHLDGCHKTDLSRKMAAAISTPDAGAAAPLRSAAAQTLHRVDNSHPPTRFRIKVIEAADQ